jgi:hypothetical protein
MVWIKTRHRGSLTFSALLLLLALVFLTSSISLYVQSMGAALAEPAKIDGLAAQSGAASLSLSSLIEDGPLSFTLSGSNATFLLDSARLKNYQRELARADSFFEAYSGPGNLTINTTEAAIPVAYLRPQNISANFADGSMNFAPALAAEVDAYYLSLSIKRPQPSFLWANISTVANTSDDALYFSIGVQGSGSGLSNATWLNRSSFSRLLVLDKQNNTVAEVTISPPSAMNLTYFVPVLARATLALDSAYSSGTYAELGASIINVRSDDGTNRTASVIFDEG